MMNYLDFWIEKNRANGKHMHDGKYWTYNSVNAFCELFPYFSRRQISNILNKMVELDLIEKGNFNKSAYDRTCWYAFTEKGKSILQNWEMENTERGNGFDPEVKPIPVNNNSYRTQLINTDIYTSSYDDGELEGNNVTNVLPTVTNRYIEKEIDIEIEKDIDTDKKPLKRVSEKALQDRFNVLWSLYPRKQGKQNAFNSYKKAIKDGVTDDQIEKGIRDYLYYIKKTGTEHRYIKQGSTWFNQRCWNDDYTVSAKKEQKDVLTRMMEEERAKSADNGLFDIFGFESSRQDDYIDVQYREKE